jgi:hypothetical protein
LGDTNRLLGDHGAGFHFDAAGKRWTLSPLTQARKAEFEAWLEASAYARADEMEKVNPTAASKYRERLDGRVDAGEFTFGRPVTVRALGTNEGAVEMLRILLRPRHPEVNAESVLDLLGGDEGEQAAAAVQRVVEDFAKSQQRRGKKSDPQ